MKKYSKLLIAATLCVAGSANAAVLSSEVADNAYISVGGYDIAWAAPCAGIDPSCGAIDLSVQSAYGWGLMDSVLWNDLGLSASSFIFEGANMSDGVDTGGNGNEARYFDFDLGDIAVAAAWFSPTYNHIDYSDGVNGSLWFSDILGCNTCESFVVRQSASVAEPTTIALMAMGLAGIGFTRRKAALKK